MSFTGLDLKTDNVWIPKLLNSNNIVDEIQGLNHHYAVHRNKIIPTIIMLIILNLVKLLFPF